MSEKEIKDLAYQYVKATISPEYKSPDLALEIRTREREIASFLKFLSSRYCLVEKSKLKELWDNLMELYINGKVPTLKSAVSMFEEIFGAEFTENVSMEYQNDLGDSCEVSTIEMWRDIPEYEELYQVSNKGRIKHKATKAIGGSGYCDKEEYMLTPVKNKKGYFAVGLSKNDVYRSFLVHRLVALAFIPNPNGCKCVNHINCLKDDNRVENLEWCTHSHNTRHAFAKGRMSKSPLAGKKHRVKVVSAINEEEFFFETIIEAGKFVGVSSPTIRRHLKRKSICKGYKIIECDSEQ